MEIEQSCEELIKEQSVISRQIEQYRRINASLKKNIHNREKYINHILVLPERFAKSNGSHTFEHLTANKTKQIKSVKKERIFTVPKNWQKQNIQSNKYIQRNYSIFKEKTFDLENTQQNHSTLKLPILERKNIFSENCQIENKPKTIKVSIDRLVVLKPEEVKKKFEMKFRNAENN